MPSANAANIRAAADRERAVASELRRDAEEEGRQAIQAGDAARQAAARADDARRKAEAKEKEFTDKIERLKALLYPLVEARPRGARRNPLRAGWQLGWDRFPHAISRLAATLRPLADEAGALLAAQFSTRRQQIRQFGGVCLDPSRLILGD